MNSTQHAVIEVSADEIIVRVGSRWLLFTADVMKESDGRSVSFALTEAGFVSVNGQAPEEMDFAAERLIRELMIR